ncbi:MAG: hypothetical protein K8T26_05060 [Lentisphaerae bacterium]|nr:hypothetical protein [Lentisphaerota bacterium]
MMARSKRVTGTLAALALVLSAAPIQAQTVRYVDAASAAAAPGGTSWADAYVGLESALAVAVSGNQIWVAAGTYKPGAVKASTFQMKNTVAVYGGFQGAESALGQRVLNVSTSLLSGEIGDPGSMADNCDHVVTAETGATLDGFTIAFGYSTANNGGGLYNIQKGMTVRNCTFTRNYADGAGNTAGGGAIYFDGNSASALFTIDRCRFLANATLGGGGAVLIRGSAQNIRIDNSLFIDNARGFPNGSGRWGGDVANARGSVASVGHIVNCTFFNKAWESIGVGIVGGDSGQAGHLKLVNCIVYKDGIGTNMIGRAMNTAQVTLHNCLIDGEFDIGSSGGATNIMGTELRLTDPEFVSLVATNLHLLTTSPCLDAGTSETTPVITMPVVDLDGARRPLDAGYDMGAYEGGVVGRPPDGVVVIVR